MSNQTSDNNKRIAKNTLLLYFRMLFMMVVSLYTSRVILNALGVEDFGIYNVVGGVVAMFTVISGSLSAAISRFITYELGKGDQSKLNRIFSASVTIQLLLSLIIVVLIESVGVWFLNAKMTIPADRITAANWVLQFSIITFVINLISVPYNAVIIAHEKMSAFAYISILEALCKLAIAFLIMRSPIDKLIYYAVLMCIVAIIVRLTYGHYCKKHFSECTYHFLWDKELLSKMFSFAGWQFFGTGSYMLMTQGVNILLNFFFGPVVNAARGIAVQVDGIIQQFVNNFTTAINPQITKSYAGDKKAYMFLLIYTGAKYSYFLVLFFAIPIILETNTILTLWLKNVPEHTVSFLRLIICIDLLYVLSNTMMTAMISTGNIKKYQIIVGGTGILVFPISWLCFYFGLPPEVAFIIQFLIFIIQLVYRLILLHEMIGLPIIGFCQQVLLKAFVVTIVAFIPPLLVHNIISANEILRFIIVGAISVCVTIMTIYCVGLSTKEKNIVKSKIKQQFNKHDD